MDKKPRQNKRRVVALGVGALAAASAVLGLTSNPSGAIDPDDPDCYLYGEHYHPDC